jgi:hypothetical protein
VLPALQHSCSDRLSRAFAVIGFPLLPSLATNETTHWCFSTHSSYAHTQSGYHSLSHLSLHIYLLFFSFNSVLQRACVISRRTHSSSASPWCFCRPHPRSQNHALGRHSFLFFFFGFSDYRYSSLRLVQRGHVGARERVCAFCACVRASVSGRRLFFSLFSSFV